MRFTISTDTSNSVATSPWNGEWPLSRPCKNLRKAARIASICLVVYWLVIFAGTHLPTTAVPQVALSDKLCHVLAFAGLSFLLAWALPNHGKRLRHVSWAAGIACVYGCIDELTQNFIPGRMCDIWDLAADGVGIVIGLCCYLVLRQLLLGLSWGRSLLTGLSR